MERFKKIFSGFMSSLAVVCMLQAAIFLHFHTIDGEIIYHSHPFSNDDGSHHHTRNELDFLSVISIFGAVVPVLFAFVSLLYVQNVQLYADLSSALCEGLHRNRKSRAPPVCC